ncbi:helix-turn-helix domain-containing protein [Aeribacillus pallidus]|uniref:helix-turn-helix domain-containing protein n=1 Tax=Aeribacillus pallidus TaxID=33936 RepID=UPI003D256271
MVVKREWLKQRRKEKGLTGTEIAKMANIGVGTYYNYENGQRTPRKEHAIRIAEILDFPVSYFFYDDVREARQKESRKEVI